MGDVVIRETHFKEISGSIPRRHLATSRVALDVTAKVGHSSL